MHTRTDDDLAVARRRMSGRLHAIHDQLADHHGLGAALDHARDKERLIGHPEGDDHGTI